MAFASSLIHLIGEFNEEGTRDLNHGEWKEGAFLEKQKQRKNVLETKTFEFLMQLLVRHVMSCP